MTEVAKTSVPPQRIVRRAKVAKIKDYTPQFRELFVECVEPQEFQFRAGQFVMLHVPTSAGKPALRAYSIASTEKIKSGYRLVFKFVENGVASQFVWALKENAEIQFTGPFGKVFFAEPPLEQAVFLNTGSGISQHFSMIESFCETYPETKYRLLFGLRFEADIYYQDELNRLKTKAKNFEYEYVISRPSPNWKGKAGYVQNFIKDFNYTSTPTTFYLCGNGAMIKDVKAVLAQDGFDQKRVFAEAFD